MTVTRASWDLTAVYALWIVTQLFRHVCYLTRFLENDIMSRNRKESNFIRLRNMSSPKTTINISRNTVAAVTNETVSS